MVNNFVTRLASLWNAGVQLSRGPIARASVLSLGIRLSGLALSFFQAILTARLLGPAGYGAVATVLSAAQILAMVAMFGFGPMAVREIPAIKATGEMGRIVGFLRFTITITFLLSCVLAAVTVYALVPALGSAPSLSQKLAFGGILVMPFAHLVLLRGWAQGFGQISSAQVPGEVLRPAVMVSALLASLVSGFAFTETDYLLVAISSGIIAVAASLALLWRSDLRKLPRRANQIDYGSTIYSALPFLGLSLAAILQGELNTLLLAALATPEQTGLYQPLARIAPLLTLPVQAAGMRYAPRIAELWKAGDLDRIQSITRTFVWTTTLITLVLGLLVSLSGPWIMLVFGQEFVGIAPFFWIIAGAQLVNAACGPAGMVLVMSGHAREAFAGQLAGLLANLLIGASLIPQSGVLGATIAMAGGILIWNGILLVMAVRMTGIRPAILAFFDGDK